jgi:hypothetical protein
MEVAAALAETQYAPHLIELVIKSLLFNGICGTVIEHYHHIYHLEEIENKAMIF